MSKGIVSRLRDTPEGARQHEREARMELGGLLEEAAATIEVMLAALEGAWKEMQGWSWTGNARDKGPYDDHLARIRAAIAKATGEQP